MLLSKWLALSPRLHDFMHFTAATWLSDLLIVLIFRYAGVPNTVISVDTKLKMQSLHPVAFSSLGSFKSHILRLYFKLRELHWALLRVAMTIALQKRWRQHWSLVRCEKKKLSSKSFDWKGATLKKPHLTFDQKHLRKNMSTWQENCHFVFFNLQMIWLLRP